MLRYFTLLCFSLTLLFSCKPEAKDATTSAPTAAKTNTINTPIKVANQDVPPPAVKQQVQRSAGGAPLGSISNPIMNGLSNGQPPRPKINLNQPGGAPGAISAPTRTPEPPQNAKGVWHYICPDGHGGGSGKAEPCKSCQKLLVHNQAYHQ